jgi:hypothetical protein
VSSIDFFRSGGFPESSEPRSSIVVVIVVPLSLLAPRTDVIWVDEVRHRPSVLGSGRAALPDDFSVGEMRYDRNAAEAIYDHAQHPPAIEASVEAGAPGGVELGDMQMVAGIAEHDLRRRLACTTEIKTAADCPAVVGCLRARNPQTIRKITAGVS